MASELKVLQPSGRVLSTLNEDGSRRWLRPRPSRGGFWTWRRRVAYALMFIFFIIPYINVGGKPLILLDLIRREFTFFGVTFNATETVFFMLGFGAIIVTIFLVTALWGRVWCGWACPQTVYMEFLFRPVEYLLEKGFRGVEENDRKRWAPRRIAKYAIYVLLAMFLAHTFLAYFVGIDQLVKWIQGSPANHPTAFLVMLVTTVLIFFDFAYFREQTCLVACPYGRIQSVLLDPQSLIVGYDRNRGEPRGKGVKDRAESAGDCIDCEMCVTTCPTGIDIRDGLQMECIHCTQCMDACDRVMDKIGKPRGLIHYTSQAEVEGRGRHLLRPRVVIYPIALVTLLGLFAVGLGTRPDAEVTLLRGLGAPYSVDAQGQLVNQVRVRVRNRGSELQRYRIELQDSDLGLIAPINPFPVKPGEIQTSSVFVVIPERVLPAGKRQVTFRVTNDDGFSFEHVYTLVGPSTEDGI